jgi:hypothetical protein
MGLISGIKLANRMARAKQWGEERRKVVAEIEQSLIRPTKLFLDKGQPFSERSVHLLFIVEHWNAWPVYFMENFGVSYAQAYRLADAAQVIANLKVMGCQVLPERESHVRPLTKVFTKESQTAVWKMVLTEGKKVTAKAVQDAVNSSGLIPILPEISSQFPDIACDGRGKKLVTPDELEAIKEQIARKKQKSLDNERVRIEKEVASLLRATEMSAKWRDGGKSVANTFGPIYRKHKNSKRGCLPLQLIELSEEQGLDVLELVNRYEKAQKLWPESRGL